MPKKGFKHTEETKRKISEKHKGKVLTKEHKRKLSLSHLGKKGNCAMLGRKHSKKTRKKMSLAKKGKIPKNLEFLHNLRKGTKLSLEHRKKLSLAHIGQIPWNKGKYHKKESIEKMKKSHKLNPPTHWLGKHHKKESIEKYKKWRKHQILPTKDTSIEVKIQNFLKVLGVEYYTHFWINDIENKYQCDIFIPPMNLVIECDGDYWHNYPKGREIDHIRTSELLSKGFKVLRLWEREIKVMGLNDFKDKIKNGWWNDSKPFGED